MPHVKIQHFSFAFSSASLYISSGCSGNAALQQGRKSTRVRRKGYGHHRLGRDFRNRSVSSQGTSGSDHRCAVLRESNLHTTRIFLEGYLCEVLGSRYATLYSNPSWSSKASIDNLHEVLPVNFCIIWFSEVWSIDVDPAESRLVTAAGDDKSLRVFHLLSETESDAARAAASDTDDQAASTEVKESNIDRKKETNPKKRVKHVHWLV